jgi:hypothetical protein
MDRYPYVRQAADNSYYIHLGELLKFGGTAIRRHFDRLHTPITIPKIFRLFHSLVALVIKVEELMQTKGVKAAMQTRIGQQLRYATHHYLQMVELYQQANP